MPIGIKRFKGPWYGSNLFRSIFFVESKSTSFLHLRPHHPGDAMFFFSKLGMKDETCQSRTELTLCLSLVCHSVSSGDVSGVTSSPQVVDSRVAAMICVHCGIYQIPLSPCFHIIQAEECNPHSVPLIPCRMHPFSIPTQSPFSNPTVFAPQHPA